MEETFWEDGGGTDPWTPFPTPLSLPPFPRGPKPHSDRPCMTLFLSVGSQLWASGIKAEFGYKANPQMADQLSYALKAGIPLMVLFGETEVSEGVVKVKDLAAQSEDTMPVAGLVEDLRRRLGRS